MEFTRRKFLKLLMTAGALAPIAGCVSSRELAKAVLKTGALPCRVLGRTNVPVTILGLGCVEVGRGSEADARAAVETAIECGVRYFDTAPNYADSEERLGSLLGGVREDIFLATKLDHPDARGAEEDLRQSLKRLKTDHVDLLLQHGVGLPGWSDTDMMLGKNGSLKVLRWAKREGLTRFIGITIHPPHGPALKLLDQADDFDVVMPFVNYVSRAKINAEGEIVERARRDGLGVVAMKVLGNGALADDYDRAFRYALSVPGISCILIGVKNAKEVRRAVGAARDFRPLSDAEMKETIRLGEKLVRDKSSKVAMIKQHFTRDFWNVS